MRALSTIGDPTNATKRTVLAGLEDSDAQVRTAAVDALCLWGNFDEGSLGLLLPLLEDPNEQVRVLVTKVLPQLAGANPVVIEGLCCRLRDDTDLVQAYAAQALGELGSAATAAGKTLLHAAQTGDASVRERAMRAIALIRPSETLATFDESEVEPGLIDALREIEVQIQTNSVDTSLNIIPVIVTNVDYIESNQSADATLNLDRVALEESITGRSERPKSE